MWSSTPSTPSTIPIDDRWARSVSSQDISVHHSEFYCPSAVFSDNFLQKLTTPIPIAEKEDLKESNKCVERTEQDQCSDECVKSEFGKECVGWDFTRSRLRSEAADRKRLPKDFLLSKKPWYVSPNENPNETDPINRYYCMPKICVELGHHFVHYKKIIEYMKNGIFIFLIDLRYGTEKSKLKTLKHIDRALNICDMISMMTVAIGFEITGRYLKTGLVKHNADVFLDQDSTIILTANRKYSDRCSHQVIYTNFTDFISRMVTGDVIHIGERIKLQVVRRLLEGLQCKVIQEGLLTSAMPVKIPIERTLEPIELTREEEEDVLFAIKQKADFIVCPCAYKPKLIHYIRWLIASYKWEVKTFAKIEMSYDILRKDVDLFATEYSGVWIHGYFCGSERTFAYLVDKCYSLNKLLVRSLIFKSEDMRFDPADENLKQRLFLYADCISTPVFEGIHPVKVKSFIRKTYPEMNEDMLNYSCKYFLQSGRSIEHVFLQYAYYTSVIEQVTCIIMLNNSGKSVCDMSRKRPLVPIIANVCDVPLSRSLMLLKNVFPLRHLDPSIMNWEQELESRLECCIEFAKNMRFVRRDEPFMVCYDSQRGKKSSDTYRILYVE